MQIRKMLALSVVVLMVTAGCRPASRAADKLAQEADAAEFALKQVEGDSDMPELQRHWRTQVNGHRVLMNEATAPLDCVISLTAEEQEIVRTIQAKKQAQKEALVNAVKTVDEKAKPKWKLRGQPITDKDIWTATGFEHHEVA